MMPCRHGVPFAGAAAGDVAAQSDRPIAVPNRQNVVRIAAVMWVSLPLLVVVVVVIVNRVARNTQRPGDVQGDVRAYNGR
jgi:hypothetical protein